MSDKKIEMVRVRATKEGYDNVAVRQPGDVFDMPKGAKGSWFEPVEAASGKAQPPAANPAGPNAKDTIASISGLNDEQLNALAVTEDDREGGPRSSVVNAIAAEQKKRAAATPKTETPPPTVNGDGDGDGGGDEALA